MKKVENRHKITKLYNFKHNIYNNLERYYMRLYHLNKKKFVNQTDAYNILKLQ